MFKRTRFAIVVALGASVVAVLAAVAAAATVNFGNAAIPRQYTDTFNAFSIVDTAATAPSGGVVTDFNYYAANTKSFKFVVIDSVAGAHVLWVSPDITPSGVGAATFTPAVPVPVQAGNLIGIYSDSTGVIPFTLNSAAFAGSGPDPFTNPGQPNPTVGATLAFVGITDRDYSYNADAQNCTFSIGQPINADGSSVFKAKRGVIPVKLVGCTNPNLAPQISIVQTSGSSPGPVNDVSSVSAADTGTTMRFDPTAGQYIYNLDVSSLAGAGSYTLTITVAGETVATVVFGLS
jgi:hypothetical protein